MNGPPLFVEELQAHLLRWRGSWIAKLPDHLRSALEAIDPDLRIAATIMLHGPRECPEGRQRPVTRIKDGWQFCATSKECPCWHKHFTEKSVATNLAKHGVENAAQSEEVKAKMRQTCLERYGVETTGASEARKAKAVKTNLERYGVENVFAAESIKAKIKKTTLANYGVEHISCLPQHQEKMRQAVKERYGVDNVGKVPEIRQKIVETNLVRYGGAAPAASMAVREKMRAMMEDRFWGHFNQQHISLEHRIIDEDDFRRRFAGRRASEIAEETGYHPSVIHRYAVRWGVPLDYSVDDKRGAENAFAERLVSEGLVFDRNVRVLTFGAKDRRSRKEIDFYFPEARLGVELCGVYWHSSACERNKHYHADKLIAARNEGISLIQIFEDEWNDHPEAVIATILHKLGRTKHRIAARKCEIAEIDHARAAAFLDVYHVYGRVSATFHLALTHNEEIVAVMSFIKRKPGEWELARYASHGSVVGGASRLLAAFERRVEYERLTSFVDLRWSEGHLYEKLGFVVDKRYGPDYAYVIGNRRVHTFNLRKSSKRFAQYQGMNLTERQIAEMEGIPRIYDAGKLRVVKLVR